MAVVCRLQRAAGSAQGASERSEAAPKRKLPRSEFYEIQQHSKDCKSYPSAKQRRRGNWRKKARLCHSKEAECGGKLYAAKLTYFIANIAKATYSRSGQKLTQESKASHIACSNSSEPGGKPSTERSLYIITHSKYCKSYPLTLLTFPPQSANIFWRSERIVLAPAKKTAF